MRRTPYRKSTRAVAASTVAVLCAQLLTPPVYASEPDAAMTQVASNQANAQITEISFNRGIVTISYDLSAPEARGTLDATLEVSINGGQTYDVQPRSMSGDVGPAVSPGRSKRIVWEAGKDVESLQTDQFRFRIVIRVVMRSEEPATAPPADSAQTRPGVQPPTVTPPAISTPARQASKGNRLLWPGLGMFGAGGVLATLAGAGPLRKRTNYRDYYELTPNKPAVFGGAGVAATGLLLLLLGSRGPSNTALVVPIPGGVMLYRATRF